MPSAEKYKSAVFCLFLNPYFILFPFFVCFLSRDSEGNITLHSAQLGWVACWLTYLSVALHRVDQLFPAFKPAAVKPRYKEIKIYYSAFWLGHPLVQTFKTCPSITNIIKYDSTCTWDLNVKTVPALPGNLLTDLWPSCCQQAWSIFRSCVTGNLAANWWPAAGNPWPEFPTLNTCLWM